MKENYTYPAIIDYTEKGFINILFPDFPAACTCVQNGEDYITAAQEILALAIIDFEESEEELPKPSNIQELAIKEQQQLAYINVWMPYHRTQVKVVYVKKTLTIPAWIDELAKANNINFSATLVEAIRRKLSLKDVSNTRSQYGERML